MQAQCWSLFFFTLLFSWWCCCHYFLSMLLAWSPSSSEWLILWYIIPSASSFPAFLCIYILIFLTVFSINQRASHVLLRDSGDRKKRKRKARRKRRKTHLNSLTPVKFCFYYSHLMLCKQMCFIPRISTSLFTHTEASVSHFLMPVPSKPVCKQRFHKVRSFSP